ncbi:MAG: hypothetical protein R3C18_17305 [Planctomycetaceae bacterium]
MLALAAVQAIWIAVDSSEIVVLRIVPWLIEAFFEGWFSLAVDWTKQVCQPRVLGFRIAIQTSIFAAFLLLLLNKYIARNSQKRALSSQELWAWSVSGLALPLILVAANPISARFLSYRVERNRTEFFTAAEAVLQLEQIELVGEEAKGLNTSGGRVIVGIKSGNRRYYYSPAKKMSYPVHEPCGYRLDINREESTIDVPCGALWDHSVRFQFANGEVNPDYQVVRH